MPSREYFKRIDACKTHEAIVSCVNAEVIALKAKAGAETFDEATINWSLDHFADIDEVREASTALRNASEDRDKSEILDEISGILDAGMLHYHRLANG